MTEIIFGRNLLSELEPTVNTPCLVVTMEDLVPHFGHYFSSGHFRTHCVVSIERQDL
jgi:hypothetical protein